MNYTLIFKSYQYKRRLEQYFNRIYKKRHLGQKSTSIINLGYFSDISLWYFEQTRSYIFYLELIVTNQWPGLPNPCPKLTIAVIQLVALQRWKSWKVVPFTAFSLVPKLWCSILIREIESNNSLAICPKKVFIFYFSKETHHSPDNE